ncbi:MAG: hypothetical protein H0U59_11020 [Gemmatimonadaceae bacterium]|nr:hypothetical protein [Gemmatimonadaceae bacterium]
MGTSYPAPGDATNVITVRAKKVRHSDTLRLMAVSQGVDPIVLLKHLIKRHPTLRAAAAELGITDRGFRKMRARYGVRVVRS